MGWNPFSSKTVVNVGTSVSRLLSDDLLPNSVQTGLIKALLKGRDLPLSLVDEMSAGLAVQADAMYGYSQNGYLFGSPSGDFLVNNKGEELARVYLSSITTAGGGFVTMDYYHFGTPNLLHFGWMRLVKDYGYDTETNELKGLKASKGAEVYLHDMQIELPETLVGQYDKMALQQWGAPARSMDSPTRPSKLGLVNAHSKPVLTERLTDGVLVTYAWIDPVDKKVKRESISITLPEINNRRAYMQAKYFHEGKAYYWAYELGSEVYPAFERLLDMPLEEGGNYFPFVHFRSQKAGFAEGTPEYTSSVTMCKKIGLDYKDILTAIEANSGIGEVEQAFMAMMVPVNTEDPVEQEYLFDYFQRMHDLGDGTASITPLTAQYPVLGTPQDSQYASEVIQDTKVKLLVVNNGVLKLTFAANDGPVGTVSSGFLEDDQVSYHFFRKQTSPNTCVEVRVTGLRIRYWVNAGYYTSGDGEQDILMIPVDRSLSKHYSLPKRERLYSRSLHLVFNSMSVQTVKWYQQEWFSVFLQIVAVVLFVYSVGSSSAVTSALAAGASATAVIAAVLITVVIEVLYSMAVSYVFKLVAEVLGTDLSLLLAVIAAAYGLSKAYSAGSIAASTTAQTALQVANGMVNAVTQVTMDALKAVYEEMKTFSAMEQEKNKLLEDTQKLLEENHRVSPLFVVGETPDEYYARTVHSGNVGTIGYLAVSHFVDASLKLPRVSDTAEGFEYE